MLLTNNVLLVVACATVLLGTLYPLLIDALGVGKISVGPPYFNAVFVPVMTPPPVPDGASVPSPAGRKPRFPKSSAPALGLCRRGGRRHRPAARLRRWTSR
jgi:cytochrome c biogenesis factor